MEAHKDQLHNILEAVKVLDTQKTLLHNILLFLRENAADQRREKAESESLSKETLVTFFQNIGAVSTLGSGVTFALIVSQLQDPQEVSRRHHFDLSTVRILISVSWFLFTVTLVLGIFLGGTVKSSSTSESREGQRMLAVVLLYPLIGAAFICLALTVAAYVDVVGFLILGLVLSGPLVVAPLIWCFKGAQKLRQVTLSYGR